MAEMDNKSDWHEQVEFSQLFFRAGMFCKERQREDDILGWSLALQAKVSWCMGILEEERDSINTKIKEVKRLTRTYASILEHSLKRGQNERAISQIKHKLSDMLFDIEADIDTMVNQKMPFLNIKKKEDIRGL